MKSTASNIVIVLAQFCGTSLWFAGNAIVPTLNARYSWPPDAVAFLVSATQLGFIIGTLAFALFGLVDRFSPSRIFFLSCLCGAMLNAIMLVDLSSVTLGFITRFLVGISLAGIYPVGMKIAADWNKEGLGQWLGSLVGALVIGTAFPHLIKLQPSLLEPLPYFAVISATAITGGILLFAFVGDGPYRRESKKFAFGTVTKMFTSKPFQGPALGYFGHMWEVYAWWAFVPWIVATYNARTQGSLNIPLISFFAIASGFIGCAGGGVLSRVAGSFKVAWYALLGSGICCLISPWMFQMPATMFFIFILAWGALVAGDSPQFSTLIAQRAPDEFRGSAITLSTCIGFAITILSIQLLNILQYVVSSEYLFWFLLPGPLFGLFSMFRSSR